MTKEFLYEFIRKNKYAVLSTVTADMQPEAALVGIAVTRDLKIIFDTVNTSRKYYNLANNASVALVIGWNDEQTVQYEGVARLPSTAELNDVLAAYFGVFPDGIKRKEHMKNLVHFCVEPKWIRYSDFRTPGKIEEITLK